MSLLSAVGTSRLNVHYQPVSDSLSAGSAGVDGDMIQSVVFFIVITVITTCTARLHFIVFFN